MDIKSYMFYYDGVRSVCPRGIVVKHLLYDLEVVGSIPEGRNFQISEGRLHSIIGYTVGLVSLVVSL